MSVPTAGEFYKSFPCKQGKTLELMIEFAKLHVEAALKQASEDAWMIAMPSVTKEEVVRDITDAYPLDLIK